MELKQIRMGIVGAGTWGATHASIYAEHICADPVAICDMNKEKRRRRLRSNTGSAKYIPIIRSLPQIKRLMR